MPTPYFGTQAWKYSEKIRKGHDRFRRIDVECAWLAGYAEGLKMWAKHDREMGKLAKTPCIPRKRGV